MKKNEPAQPQERKPTRFHELLQFIEWDIQNIWANCRALGFTPEDIRIGIRDLSDREYASHTAPPIAEGGEDG